MLMIKRVMVAGIKYISNGSKSIHVLCGPVYSSNTESLISPGVRKHVNTLLQRHTTIMNTLSSEDVRLFRIVSSLLIYCNFRQTSLRQEEQTKLYKEVSSLEPLVELINQIHTKYQVINSASYQLHMYQVINSASYQLHMYQVINSQLRTLAHAYKYIYCKCSNKCVPEVFKQASSL